MVNFPPANVLSAVRVQVSKGHLGERVAVAPSADVQHVHGAEGDLLRAARQRAVHVSVGRQRAVHLADDAFAGGDAQLVGVGVDPGEGERLVRGDGFGCA